MAARLNIKDTVQQWTDKINNLMDLQNVDGAFINSETSWVDTEFTLTGGKVRSGSNILDVAGASLTLPVAEVSIVGINTVSSALEDYLDTNVPATDFIPLYIITTNNERITDAEDARTWAYEDSGAALDVVADHEAKADPHPQYATEQYADDVGIESKTLIWQGI